MLQAQISAGDLLTATVLAPQGGQDLLEILGQRVIAHLPPDVRPGEQLVLQVTGFESNRILVRNLGIADPNNPPASLDVELPAPGEPSAAAAPPREVFVAASVQPGALPAGPLPDPAITPAAPVPEEADVLEARIATARIVSSDLQAAAVAGAFQAREAPPMFVRPVAAAPSRASADPVATPSNILRTLRIAQTPLTVAAAQAASSAVARFPAVLIRLQAALPQSSNDPRVATLRTLIGFLEQLDPRNEHAFIDQLSSFVNNVLEGAEAKLSALLRAHVTVDTAALLPKAVSAASAHQGTIAPSASEQTDNPPDSPIESVVTLTAQAKAAERSIAIDHDLKSLVLSARAHTPRAGHSSALTSPERYADDPDRRPVDHAVRLGLRSHHADVEPTGFFFRRAGGLHKSGFREMRGKTAQNSMRTIFTSLSCLIQKRWEWSQSIWRRWDAR